MLSNDVCLSRYIFDVGREDEEHEVLSFKYVRLLPDMVILGIFDRNRIKTRKY